MKHILFIFGQCDVAQLWKMKIFSVLFRDLQSSKIMIIFSVCFRLTVNVIQIPHLVSSRIWTFGGLVGQMVGISNGWMDFGLGG